MINKDRLLNERLGKKIQDVFLGLNLIPTMKESFVRDLLNSNISKDKVDKLFCLENVENVLDKNELKSFIINIYKFTSDEDFNPSTLLKKKKDKRNDDGKIYKDEDESLYFNFDFKTKFANAKYKEDTKKVVMSLFRKSSVYENEYSKDLYDFNTDELKVFLKSLKARSLRSIQNSISTIEQYIDYAIKNERTEFKVNNAELFNSKDVTKQLLNTKAIEEFYMDKEEVYTIARKASNAQDGVIVALLFEGLNNRKKGNQEYSELVNIKPEHVDFDNTSIKIVDEENGEVERTIDNISDEALSIISKAIDEKIYYSAKGENVRKYKLSYSEYILKGLRGSGKINWRNINQRILRMSELFELEYFNATSIMYSGQLHYAKQLKSYGHHIDDIIIKTLERFGMNINSASIFYLKKRLEERI